MPRSGRGGARQGRDGVAYSNRTDLNQGPRLDRTDLRQAADAQPAPGAPASGVAPGGMPDLQGPTAYPQRPVTHGLPSGPGAGPEVLGMASGAAMLLRQALQQYPDASDINDLLEILGEQS